MLAAALLALVPQAAPEPQQPPPNLVLIVADDLGYGELGCYGQQKIATPNLDRLAAEGMRFTRAYAGSPVCAPSRCVLLSGQSSVHAPIRDNKEVHPEGQMPLPAATVTFAERLHALGYATGCVGKWGLGPPGSSGDPIAQGFDFFFGDNCQRVAHNYYPTHLWVNDARLPLDNASFSPYQRVKAPPIDMARFRGDQYAPALMQSAALGFVRQHAGEPFVLYVPLIEPHLALQPPDRWLARQPESWDHAPYLGDHGYLPHPRPHAAYAALIADLDAQVGELVRLIDHLGLGPRTLVLFTSDNGATHDVGGVDTEFFASTGGLRGRKGSVYEGGLRVPMIARWTGHIEPGTTTDHVCGFEDVLPTLLAAAGHPLDDDAATDGISFLPTLLGQPQQEHDALLWEFHGYGGQRAVRQGRWKLVVRGLLTKQSHVELYDLEVDPGEQHDLADQHPDIVQRLLALHASRRTANADFPM